MNFIVLLLFLLKPGDAVVIRFRQPTSLSQYSTGHYTYTHVDTVFVEGDSTVFIPFIGRINTADFTAKELQDSIYSAYSGYFKRPVYNVSVMYRIYVIGEVKYPGEYFVEPYDDIWNVIGKAGGVTPDGDLHRITVIRNGKELNINVPRAMLKRKSIELMGIQSGDIVKVPRKFTVGFRQALDLAWKLLMIYSLFNNVLKK
jgi:protein involved in polysaccharide export with SLBB domain